MTGEEVVLTPESVHALAIFGSTTGSMVVLHEGSPIQQPATGSESPSGLIDISAGFEMLQSLPFRPKSPNVASGLSYNCPPISIGGLDPFKVLPETAGEPVPRQLLIRYCEYPLPSALVSDDLLTNHRYRKTGSMAVLPR